MNEMNPNIQHVLRNRLERVSKALVKNRMEVFRAETRAQVAGIVESLLKSGDVIGNGGSSTLEECGIMELLRLDCYKFLDREGKNAEELHDIYRGAFSADVYITSTNAVTENGELYNVDGRGNRVAAIAFGPKTVIVVAGWNKVVRDLGEAVERVKRFSAPANTIRLGMETYCAEKGICMEPCEDMGHGCYSEDRICCSGLISAYQRVPNRIKVVLVEDSLGF